MIDVKIHLAGLTIAGLMVCCDRVVRSGTDSDTRQDAYQWLLVLKALTGRKFPSLREKEAEEKAVRDEVCPFLEINVAFWT